MPFFLLQTFLLHEKRCKLKETFLERYFELKKRKTDTRAEIIAGVVTFMTMAYIIFVNPNLLSKGG